MDVCTSLIAWKSDNNLENYFENDLIFGGEPDGGWPCSYISHSEESKIT